MKKRYKKGHIKHTTIRDGESLTRDSDSKDPKGAMEPISAIWIENGKKKKTATKETKSSLGTIKNDERIGEGGLGQEKRKKKMKKDEKRKKKNVTTAMTQ